MGTSNNPNPLTDVQNRRWYPVHMRSVGYDLFDHEDECRAYILQCWAEMRDKYKAHDKFAQNFAKRELLEVYREQQDAARQDDLREGKIDNYLSSKSPGEFVCVIELYKRALFPDTDKTPSLVDSKDIGMMMTKFDDWKRVGVKYFSEFGKQRAWQKAGNPNDEQFELPF